MKKAITIILLATVLLTACGGQAPENTGAPQQSGEHDGKGTQLRRLTEQNSSGFYELEIDPASYNLTLCFTDFAAATKTVVCDLPDCAHDTPDCNGKYRRSTANDQIYATDDYVLVVETQNFYSTDPPSYPRIVVSDPDGGNRRELYGLPDAASYGDGHVTLEGAFFTDGNDLYFMRSEMHDTGEYPAGATVDLHGKTVEVPIYEVAWTLIRMDLKTGEVRRELPLFDLNEPGGTESYSVFGCSEDKLVFAHRTWKFDDQQGSIWDALNFIAVSVDDGTQETLLSFQYGADGESGSGLEDFTLLTLAGSDHESFLVGHKADRSVWTIDPVNNQSTRAISPADMDVHGVLLYSQTRTHFIVVAYSDDGEKIYALDKKTGALNELTLAWYTTEKMGTCPVFPIYETETEFYVISSAYWATVNGLGTGGIPIQVQQDQYVYAMIAKEDYFNNVPNYRVVQNGPGVTNISQGK